MKTPLIAITNNNNKRVVLSWDEDTKQVSGDDGNLIDMRYDVQDIGTAYQHLCAMYNTTNDWQFEDLYA